MASQTKTSSTWANDTSSGGVIAWTNPDNAEASDDARATITGQTGESAYLLGTDWGFTIPTGANISGIVVSVERSNTSGGIADGNARLFSGGSAVSDDKASGTAWPASDTVATYGAAIDLWGQSWTPALINATDFGFGISSRVTSFPGGSRIDYIEITVHYDEVTSDWFPILPPDPLPEDFGSEAQDWFGSHTLEALPNFSVASDGRAYQPGQVFDVELPTFTQPVLAADMPQVTDAFDWLGGFRPDQIEDIRIDGDAFEATEPVFIFDWLSVSVTMPFGTLPTQAFDDEQPTTTETISAFDWPGLPNVPIDWRPTIPAAIDDDENQTDAFFPPQPSQVIDPNGIPIPSLNEWAVQGPFGIDEPELVTYWIAFSGWVAYTGLIIEGPYYLEIGEMFAPGAATGEMFAPGCEAGQIGLE